MKTVADNNSNKKISVYYDGLCHLCSREINHYKKMEGSKNIHFIDITDPIFQAQKEGLDPIAIHKTIHVRDQNKNLKIGIEAFICIWEQLPSLRFLAKIVRIEPFNSTLKLFYSIFAKVRPLLPRKSCENSPYCEIHKKSL